MKTRSNSRHFILLSSMLIGVIDVHAQAVDKPCVELNSEAKVEQPYTDAQGKKAMSVINRHPTWWSTIQFLST